MNQINIATKKFTDAVKIDIGQLPVTDVKIDFNLTDGTNPVIAENKTFTLTIGTVNGELYKTDDDTVSYRYLKFDDNNVADSLAITMKMNGEEILNDTVSLTYQTSGGIDTSVLDKKLDAPAAPGTVGQVLTKTADGQEWDNLPDDNDYLCFTAEQANSTVRLDKIETPPEINLEYSTDKKTWTEYTWNGNTGATITLANIGDSMWMRGNNNTFSTNIFSYHGFVMSGKIKASGNIMSLLDKTCESKELKTKFSRIFLNCTSLTTAPELPATTLYPQCYEGMFSECKSLTKAPELPATTLQPSCYQSMFYGCSSLTEAPVLKSTQLVSNCYKEMFRNCGRLKKVVALFEADSWGGGNCEMWLDGISTDGVFVCSPYLYGIPNSGSWGIPSTWKKETIYSPTTKKAVESTSSSITIYENNSKVDKITVSNSLTINAGHYVTNNLIAYAEIVLDVATGATVTAGTNLTLVDTPTAGKRNICVCRWSGGACKLYVTIVEDLPQA